MRILLTGASSFTGWWFARRLVEAGHDVLAPITRPLEAYEGRRLARLRSLPGACRLSPGVEFGTDSFLALLDQGPWDLLCHHGARVTGYREPGFDVAAAFAANTRGLNAVLDRFAARGGRAVVLTGSVFEADEGAGTAPLRAFSPYGVSKTVTWQAFRYAVAVRGLSLAKFTIPNPFGPHEDERLTDYLHRAWQRGDTPSIKTPDYVRDNIHVSLLSLAYARVAAGVGAAAAGTDLRANPSGYVESQGAFVRRYAEELGRRLGRTCPVTLGVQESWDEPLVRVNTEPARLMCPEWSETESWDAIAQLARDTWAS